MEITINIDNNKFDEVVQKELDAFSKQELQELCRQGIIKCLADPTTFQALFTNKEPYYSNYTSAKDLLKEAAKTINFDDLFKEVQDKIVNYVRENQMDLVKDIIMNIFTNGLSCNLYNNNNFESRLSAEIYNMMPRNN